MKNLVLTIALLLGVGATSAFAQTHNHRLYIHNDSGTAIYNVHISSSSDPNWGRDMLGSDVILNGRTQYATLVGHRWYDVRVVQSDDTTCVQQIDLNANKTLVIRPYSCYVSSETTSTQY